MIIRTRIIIGNIRIILRSKMVRKIKRRRRKRIRRIIKISRRRRRRRTTKMEKKKAQTRALAPMR